MNLLSGLDMPSSGEIYYNGKNISQYAGNELNDYRNLEPQNTEQILRLFNNISKSCLVILISHNNISAKKYTDRVPVSIE